MKTSTLRTLRPFFSASTLFVVAALLATAPRAAADPAPAAAPTGCRALARMHPGDRALQACASMSLDEKIAQMIMSYPPLDKAAPVTVGAVILLGPLLKNEETVRDRVEDLQRRAKIPLLVAVDMEGGRLNRLQFVPALRQAPSGQALGKMSVEAAEAWGKTLGREMKALGLNCNLGPVLDLADEGMMFEKERAMGSDPAQVARVAAAYTRGMASEGILAIGKHFPGYGALAENSDFHLVRSDRTLEQIEHHARPFFALGRLLGGVMLTNIAFSQQGDVPAILSPELVAKAHAHDATWITMTDDLAVPSLKEATGDDAEEVVRRAFLAGNDVLLTTAPVDWDKGLDLRRIVRELVEKTPSLEGRIDESVVRLLRLKERMGLLDNRTRDTPPQGRAEAPPLSARDTP